MENNIKDRIELLKHDSRLLVEYKYNHPSDIDRIMYFKSRLLKKYDSYFNSRAYKGKMSLFNASLSKTEENYNTSSLVIANRIFKEEIGDYVKYCKLKKLFLNEEELFDKYFYYVIPLIENPIITNLYKIELFYKDCRKKGYDEKDKTKREEEEFLLREEKYNDLYDYSKFVINSYINDGDSYLFDIFLDKLGIDEQTFNTCLDVVNELDVFLYNKYLYTKKVNARTMQNYNMYQLKSIARGIETGYTFDGTPFDILEFYKLVPYKYNNKLNRYNEELRSINMNENLCINFNVRIKELGKKLSVKESALINNYINTINPPEKINLLDEKSLLFNELYMNGKRLTIEDSKKVIEYMKCKNYPFIKPVYNELLRRYVSNALVFDNLTHPVKKVLIP